MGRGFFHPNEKTLLVRNVLCKQVFWNAPEGFLAWFKTCSFRVTKTGRERTLSQEASAFFSAL